MKLIECVPNFSEGRDKGVIEAIVGRITAVGEVRLLDVDPGEGTNRTVVTFVGPPDAVVEAALGAIEEASRRIDMSKHKGAHPRMGATDVCPFVPVAEATMEECVDLARRLGARVGELGIPVYLYEAAASRPDRRNLAEIRKGEYEGFGEKILQAEWKPDFGPATFNPRWGVTAIGARQFLIAYNVNLNTRSRALAHDIAITIREKGRFKKDEEDRFVRGDDNRKIRQPGTLDAVKATGWYIDEYHMAQVSMNLVDIMATPPHEAFEEVERQAQARGLRVTGSELVGLLPRKSIVEAGRYFLRKQGLSPGVPEPEAVRLAVQTMGLEEISPFVAEEKVIEYRVRPETSLVRDTVRGFADGLSSDSPAPGGGSVAALAGALGSALNAMVANLTVGKKGYEEVHGSLGELAVEAQDLKEQLLDAVDQDTEAFNALMACFKMARKTAEEKEARRQAIQQATRGATLVPLGVLKAASKVLDMARVVIERGNVNSLSDGGVAALMGRASAEGAYYNVMINLQGLEDRDEVQALAKEARGALREALDRADSLSKTVRERLDLALSD